MSKSRIFFVILYYYRARLFQRISATTKSFIYYTFVFVPSYVTIHSYTSSFIEQPASRQTLTLFLTVPFQNSSSLPWATDRTDALSSREGGLSPPPPKRSRSSDHAREVYTPDPSDRIGTPSRGNGDVQESFLGRALEGGPTIHTNVSEKKWEMY